MIIYWCGAKQRKCTNATELGFCKCTACMLNVNHGMTTVNNEQPNEFTINGVVYVKKGEL